MESKNCTRCKEHLPLTAFAFSSSSSDRYQYWCRACTKEVNHEWYMRHIAEKARKAAEWYAIPENQQKVILASRERHAANREEINARHRAREAKKKLEKQAQHQT